MYLPLVSSPSPPNRRSGGGEREGRGEEERRVWGLNALCTGKDQNVCTGVDLGKRGITCSEYYYNKPQNHDYMEKFPTPVINKAITTVCAAIGVVALKNKQQQGLKRFIPVNDVFIHVCVLTGFGKSLCCAPLRLVYIRQSQEPSR